MANQGRLLSFIYCKTEVAKQAFLVRMRIKYVLQDDTHENKNKSVNNKRKNASFRSSIRGGKRRYKAANRLFIQIFSWE
jgi:hypothetical protein